MWIKRARAHTHTQWEYQSICLSFHFACMNWPLRGAQWMCITGGHFWIGQMEWIPFSYSDFNFMQRIVSSRIIYFISLLFAFFTGSLIHSLNGHISSNLLSYGHWPLFISWWHFRLPFEYGANLKRQWKREKKLNKFSRKTHKKNAFNSFWHVHSINIACIAENIINFSLSLSFGIVAAIGWV